MLFKNAPRFTPDAQIRRITVGLVVSSIAGLLTTVPAQAGWVHNYGGGILPVLVHRVAQRAIQAELNEIRYRQTERFASFPHGQFSPAHRIKANPPMMMTTTSAFARPLPGYQWSPNPAAQYLQNDEQSGSGGTTNDDDAQDLSPSGEPGAFNPSQMRSSLVGRRAPFSAKPETTHFVPPSVVSQAFNNGAASHYSYQQLVAAKVFAPDPLHGSVFKRKAPVRYIILHSTETASPADARRVILSWNNRGVRHPGSQFVVDRDGTICSTVNPDQVTVHIDTRKTLPGYSNDNSVGIEIVRSGKQQYTQPQLESVTKLVSYLQGHYGIADSDVTTHHHVQPSDRSDPVGFDFLAFENAKSELRGLASSTLPNQIYNPRPEHRFVSAMPRSAPDLIRH